MIRTILVPLTAELSGEPLLDAALVLARRVNAHIRALFILPNPHAILAYLPDVVLAAGVTRAVPPRVEEALEKAAAQTTRAGEIIRRLRQFVAKDDSEHRFEDLNNVVEEASALALVGAKQQGVRVMMELARDVPRIALDKIQIQQVVLNLVRNAVEAMSATDERLLTIATRQFAKQGVGLLAEVRISDSGSGLDPSVLGQLFEPFVTTKEGGMGVGLSICRSIVEAHGGQICAEPNSQGGTSFIFTVPITATNETTNAGDPVHRG